MSKHEAVKATQVWFPNQRVIRTVVTGIIAAVPTAVAIVGILADQWPVQWLVATSAAAIAIQGVLTKIIALPGVNAWLSANTSLGSVPKSELPKLIESAGE